MGSLASHNRSVTAWAPGFWSNVISLAAENYIPFEKLSLILFWTLVEIECLNPGTSCDYATHTSHHEVGATNGIKT